MSRPLTETPYTIDAEVLRDFEQAVANLVTEDEEPVDNLYAEKQQALLKRALYSSWRPQPSEDNPQTPRPFLAAVNVGIFFSPYRPPLVPDLLLSLDVQTATDLSAKEHRSYFIWEFGKPPEVVVEIVSNREGHELDSKLRDYARLGVEYYVVYDPWRLLSEDVLRVYEPGFGRRYRLRPDTALPDVGLQLTLWTGRFEGQMESWLRWCDADGNLLLTGEERAAQEAARAEREAERAKREAERAEREAAARKEAEAEVERLRAELARLRPPQALN